MSTPTTRDAVAAIERIADERLDLQRERIALLAEVQRLTAERDALRAALVIMLRVVSVDAIDPLVAFAAVEKARAALERSAP